jgi:hypothetical protein
VRLWRKRGPSYWTSVQSLPWHRRLVRWLRPGRRQRLQRFTVRPSDPLPGGEEEQLSGATTATSSLAESGLPYVPAAEHPSAVRPASAAAPASGGPLASSEGMGLAPLSEPVPEKEPGQE